MCSAAGRFALIRGRISIMRTTRVDLPCDVDAPTPPRRDSWLMQPPRDRSVTLVQRRHVDLVRVASAVCRCR
ncbi:putative leader peptide [Streptomyces sp. NPDC018338]|uniref:putative leader peptide n=1 Tax=Streptomyces sp. NPDC018338 TaxID=3157192 RepID=UPI00340CBC36